MKKIIVPTDFSSTSHNAYLYAREMAKDIGATVEVIYVYSRLLGENKIQNVKLGQSIEGTIEEQLQSFINLYEKEESAVLTKLDVKYKLIKGLVIDSIIDASTKDDAVIVMGATGEHDTIDKLFGSTSTYIAQGAKCPVFIIPKGAKYQTFKNVLFASNFESANKKMLDKVVDFANLYRAAIHFVHVDENTIEDYDTVEDKIFDHLFNDREPGFAFSMSTVHHATVVTGLNNYARKNDIDLLVIVNSDRSLAKSIIGASITKKLALHPTFPMMVYHLKN